MQLLHKPYGYSLHKTLSDGKEYALGFAANIDLAKAEELAAKAFEHKDAVIRGKYSDGRSVGY